MTSTELVGPLPTIEFHDGTRIAYRRPTNTCDNRWVACTDHHPACDCREAELREEIDELRAIVREIEDAAREVLAGHAAYYFGRDPATGAEEQAHCMCTGCQIARRGHLTAAWHVAYERVVSAREWSRREHGA